VHGNLYTDRIQHIRPKVIEIVSEKIATDFFGRAVVAKQQDTDMDTTTGIFMQPQHYH
jgi:hypothetical protein